MEKKNILIKKRNKIKCKIHAYMRIYNTINRNNDEISTQFPNRGSLAGVENKK